MCLYSTKYTHPCKTEKDGSGIGRNRPFSFPRTKRNWTQALVTLPDFMQRVHTFMRYVLPLPSVTRTSCRFGKKRRFVMPVV